MGRPKKYEDLLIYTFRCNRAVLDAARERARLDGVTLPDILNDFLNSYTRVNSTAMQIQSEIVTQLQTVEHEEIKLAALQLRLRQLEPKERQAADRLADLRAFYNKRMADESRTVTDGVPWRKSPTRDKWLDDTAGSLGVERKELIKMLKEAPR